MSKSLEGKTALITGGGSRWGRAACLALSQAGALIIVADPDVQSGNETAAQAEKAGGKAVFIQADVSKAEEASKLLTQTIQTFGRLNIAINIAVFSSSGTAPLWDEKTWDRITDTMLKNIWRCMKYELLHMKKTKGSAIVNVALATGLANFTEESAVRAADEGMNGLTKTAALEYARRRTRINAVVAHGDHIVPEKIAETVLWLSSDESSFITGQTIPLNPPSPVSAKSRS